VLRPYLRTSVTNASTASGEPAHPAKSGILNSPGQALRGTCRCRRCRIRAAATACEAAALQAEPGGRSRAALWLICAGFESAGEDTGSSTCMEAAAVQANCKPAGGAGLQPASVCAGTGIPVGEVEQLQTATIRTICPAGRVRWPILQAGCAGVPSPCTQCSRGAAARPPPPNAYFRYCTADNTVAVHQTGSARRLCLPTLSHAYSLGASPAGAIASKPQKMSSSSCGSLSGTWESNCSSNSSSEGQPQAMSLSDSELPFLSTPDSTCSAQQEQDNNPQGDDHSTAFLGLSAQLFRRACVSVSS
jgi:hypothetical protein